MESPMVLEEGDEVLQVLEGCETLGEIKEVIVTTVEENVNPFTSPVATYGPGTKPSQVGLTEQWANWVTSLLPHWILSLVY